jgi:hypothetical protein
MNRFENTTSIGAYEVDAIAQVVNNIEGTVFPFVHFEGYPEINEMFPVTARLYDAALIPQGPLAMLATQPLYKETVVYYNGKHFIPNTPKFPGYLGCANNPGLTINWKAMGIILHQINNTSLLQGEMPKTQIGWFSFNEVEKGEYVLVLSRPGYVSRFAKISINTENQLLGHRELVPGDVDGDLTVTIAEIPCLQFAIYGDGLYNPLYDFNGDLYVDMTDMSIWRFYRHFIHTYYKETEACFAPNTPSNP